VVFCFFFRWGGVEKGPTLASAEKEGSTHYVTEVLCHSFQLLESRAQHALRENNGGADFADLVLEEEELPF